VVEKVTQNHVQVRGVFRRRHGAAYQFKTGRAVMKTAWGIRKDSDHVRFVIPPYKLPSLWIMSSPPAWVATAKMVPWPDRTSAATYHVKVGDAFGIDGKTDRQSTTMSAQLLWDVIGVQTTEHKVAFVVDRIHDRTVVGRIIGTTDEKTSYFGIREVRMGLYDEYDSRGSFHFKTTYGTKFFPIPMPAWARSPKDLTGQRAKFQQQARDHFFGTGGTGGTGGAGSAGPVGPGEADERSVWPEVERELIAKGYDTATKRACCKKANLLMHPDRSDHPQAAVRFRALNKHQKRRRASGACQGFDSSTCP